MFFTPASIGISGIMASTYRTLSIGFAFQV
ncbi:hypothetical protein CBM2599_A10301 [Cupriavidus taiwanensis]|nr:hypothetical protein CBM2599_A10301 [Cupriavidus taiwanensis]SOY80490.1 hypothetical protein CBM2600_A10147 [Cupriavidus taiwanensis]